MTTSTTTVLEKATEIAAGHAFTYAGNFGRGEFRYIVDVHVSGSDIYLTAACNAQISEKRAQAELAKVFEELKAHMLASDIPAKHIRSHGFRVWRYGFWNMGHFCTEGFKRGLTLAKQEQAA
jgi:hypothetical protein